MKTRISIYFLQAYAIIENNKDETIGFGGAELNCVNLAVELAKDPQYMIDLYVGDYGANMLEKYEGVTIKRLNFFNYQKYNGKIYSLIRVIILYHALLTDKSKCFITSCANELIGHMAIASKFKKRAILMRLAHDNDVNMDFLEKNNSKRFFKLYQYGLERADAIIAQNSSQYSRIQEMYPGKKVEIIKNAFRIDTVKAKAAGRDIILWVARCADFKRPELFVELASKVNKYKFVMVLPVNNNNKSRMLKEKVKSMAKGMKNIEILDFVPFDQIMSYFIRSLIFVSTSISEGFPNTFIQAAAAKTPILSLNVNPDNIITDYNMGYFCGDDLNQAIKYLEDYDEEKRAELGENAYRYYLQNHNLSESAAKYKKIINDIL